MLILTFYQITQTHQNILMSHHVLLLFSYLDGYQILWQINAYNQGAKSLLYLMFNKTLRVCLIDAKYYETITVSQLNISQTIRYIIHFYFLQNGGYPNILFHCIKGQIIPCMMLLVF